MIRRASSFSHLSVALLGIAAVSFTQLGCSKIKSLAGGGGLSILKGFEGEIGVTAKETKDPSKGASFTLEVKGEKVRVDLPSDIASKSPLGAMAGGKTWGLLSTSEKKATMVMEAQKKAIVFDLNKMLEKAKASATPPALGGTATPPKDPPKVTKTGKTEQVAGYECENWDIVGADGSKGTACIANEGASWFSFPLAGIPAEHAWMMEVFDGNHFPLRFTGFDKTGAEVVRVEITKIEKKTMPAEHFQVPADFQTMDFEQFISQMMMGMGARPGMPGMPPTMGSGMPPMKLPPNVKLAPPPARAK